MKIQKSFPDGVRTYQITGMRCRTCDTPFKSEIEVEVPIERYVASMRSVRCPSCQGNDLLMGMGLTLSEDRAMRMKGGSIQERVDDWLRNGETGLSSEYVVAHMTGTQAPSSHPHDYDDLRRVILLLDRIPEWSDRMAELGSVTGWAGIGPRWTEIVTAVLAADPEARSPTEAAAMLQGIYGKDRQ